jgi:hypothetical protein
MGVSVRRGGTAWITVLKHMRRSGWPELLAFSKGISGADTPYRQGSGLLLRFRRVLRLEPASSR